MSVPPSNSPPGGPYYGTPGRPANNNAGCLKAFGITCGVLILLAIIGGALLFKAGAPFIQQAMNVGRSVGQASVNGRKIQQAVVAYHAKNGKYPPNLTALVADGEITDPAVLHHAPDPPGRISWRYRRPAEGAPGSTPILDLPYTITMAGQTQTSHLIINLDGTTSSATGETLPPDTRSTPQPLDSP